MACVSVASITQEVNQQLAKHPLKTNGHLANLESTSFVKEATDGTRANVDFSLVSFSDIHLKAIF